MKDTRTVAIIQARMGSTRLPGKVMMKLKDKTALAHDIERIKQSKSMDDIVIATTVNKEDDEIVQEALLNGVKVFRGSEEDVLSRYYGVALESRADIVVRVTSDCPLIDPKVIDEIVEYYKNNDYDLVTNAGSDLSQRTYPRGLDVEVFSFESLEKAYNNADAEYQKEHVTPYIYENSDRIYYYKNDIDYSKYRWTLDTEEDLELIKAVYDELYIGEHDFYLADVVKIFEKKPNLYDINKHVEQKKI